MVQVVTAALGRSRLGSKSASSSNRGRSLLSQAPVSHWAQTVMKYINRRLLYISRSSSALFIDRPHLLTCRNIGEREPTLTLEALSLTYKCRGRVGPRESAAPVLSVNLLLQNASRSSAAPIPCTRPPDSLSADSTHTHPRARRLMKAIQSKLCTRAALQTRERFPGWRPTGSPGGNGYLAPNTHFRIIIKMNYPGKKNHQ